MMKQTDTRLHAWMLFALFFLAVPLSAQDEVRLKDGGVLEGKIIRETEEAIELKHKSFGVIRIEKDRIVSAGAYGTLNADESDAQAKSAEENEGQAAAAARRAAAKSGSTSRLDLDYMPEKYEPVAIPGESTDGASDVADIREEMAERPDLAGLYETLVNREVIKAEEAELLLALNEKWETDPDSLSPLERRIVRTLMGESDPTEGEVAEAPRRPPPPDLVPVVESIRAMLAAIEEIRYEERFSLTGPEGKTEIRYDRQVRRPHLVAGTGEVIEHVDPLEAHKAVRYFGDGQMLWLLTRRGDQTGEAFVDQSADAANLTAEERVERAQEYETPTGTRAEFSTWAVAGFPIVQMTRSDLILEPFRGLDLATLNRVSEDEEAWVFEAKIDSPAFAPMETAELRIEKSSGLLEWMRVKGATLEASIEFSGIQSGVDLPASTFVVPQAPEGRSFRVVDAPDSPSEALTLLGAL